MALNYVLIPADALGKLTFINHVESIGETIRRGRNSRTITKEEVYGIMNDEGSMTVRVPVKGALRGDFYQKEVRLINPKIVNEPVPYFDELNGKDSARNKLLLRADRIELVEGGKK